jgi:hypothetical protein
MMKERLAGEENLPLMSQGFFITLSVQDAASSMAGLGKLAVA